MAIVGYSTDFILNLGGRKVRVLFRMSKDVRKSGPSNDLERAKQMLLREAAIFSGTAPPVSRP